MFVGEAQAAWACGWRWVARMGGCGRPERGRVSLVLAQLRPCSHQHHESRQPVLSPAPQARGDPVATPPPTAPAGAAGSRRLAAQGKPRPPREGRDTRPAKTVFNKKKKR